MLISSGWALKKCSETVCKKGGYELEGTSLKGNRLINMILLMTLAYTWAIFQGSELTKKQVQKYVSRRKEPKKKYRRRSTFGVGVDAEKWVNYLEQYAEQVQQLMKLTPSKRRFYEQGLRAATLYMIYNLQTICARYRTYAKKGWARQL
ncbi:hypothetical protein QUA42_08520 [Microcoleus sp. Pol11C2]|uniref:hypothetical protein n=1 Tax=Microcoleus sp. Pol11C2 TaxID=3055389 RepID=UPI002FD4CD68